MKPSWASIVAGSVKFMVLAAMLLSGIFWGSEQIRTYLGYGTLPYHIRSAIMLLVVIVLVSLLNMTLGKLYKELADSKKRMVDHT